MMPAMQAHLEARALTACRKYVAASNEITRLTRAIRGALEACPGAPGKQTNDESFSPTHLSEMYARGDIAGEWGFMGYSGPDYQAMFDACPHCVLADQLIQQRKTARQTLGAAKRYVGKIGREK